MRCRGGWAMVLMTLVVTAGCSWGQPGASAPPPTVAPAGEVLVTVGSWESDGRDGERGIRDRWVGRFFREALPVGSQLYDLAGCCTTVAGALAEQVPTALAQGPTVAVVWLMDDDVDRGTPVARYEADLEAVVTALQAGGVERVLVANGWRYDVGEAAIGPYRDAVERVAGRTGAVLVDLSSVDPQAADADALVAAAMGEAYVR